MVDEPGARDIGIHLFLVLLGLGWLFGTPILLYGAVVTSLPLFGETPSGEEMRDAHLLLSAGLGCGLVLPLLGVAVAGLTGRRAAAWLFGAALALTVGVLGYFATL